MFILDIMYVVVDIGGTKTLVAVFDDAGQLGQTVKFPTDTSSYPGFLKSLSSQLATLELATKPTMAAVAIPGRVDRTSGVGLDFGNLPWENVPIKADVEALLGCPVIVENDANVAGLSEALLVSGEFKKVLYVTISTGIGTGLIINGIIDPDFADSEGGHMILEHDGKMVTWESFASGKTIVQRYGKKASEITDPAIWKLLAHDFTLGLLDLTALLQPQIIIIGGGVGSHFERFGAFLQAELEQYASPLVPTPVLREAKHAEEAVIYGCYELIKQVERGQAAS